MIEFRNVYLQYIKEFYSLFNFSCVINTHTLFIGDFYSGTTAIMRLLSKIDKNYSGEIFIDSINLKDIKDKDLNIAYLLEFPVLFKNKNIFKNLYFPLKIRKINKNSAKNLINSLFNELKNKNFKIFENYLNNKKTDILKLKVNKLNLSEQKILTLIRSMLWQPKFILLEDFFKDLDNDYLEVATYLINKIKTNSTVIACEEKTVQSYNNFTKIDLTINEQKKEE